MCWKSIKNMAIEKKSFWTEVGTVQLMPFFVVQLIRVVEWGHYNTIKMNYGTATLLTLWFSLSYCEDISFTAAMSSPNERSFRHLTNRSPEILEKKISFCKIKEFYLWLKRFGFQLMITIAKFLHFSSSINILIKKISTHRAMFFLLQKLLMLEGLYKSLSKSQFPPKNITCLWILYTENAICMNR